MKKIISFLITAILVISIPFSCFAKEDKIPPKSNSEFGTLTGGISEYVSAGWKCVSYESETTKTAAKIIAAVDVKLYTTGAAISRDEIDTKTNAKYAGYYWECHSATNNQKKMSAFGRHEARGSTSLVGYTSIINF